MRLALILLVWLTATAASAAVPEAQALWDRGAYRQAFAAAVEPANAGDPQAEFLLGEAYRLGRSVDPDQIEAVNWYTRAARQGDVASAAALGELLVHLRQSRDAVQWLTLAASHNHARATALLAAIYYTGDGAQPDLILATTLIKKAAALGSPEARAKLALMDDTAPPVDVSSPPEAQAALAPQESIKQVQVASAVPAPRLIQKPAARRTIEADRSEAPVRIQVGAFRSAANARRAMSLVASRTAGEYGALAIVHRNGFYKLLLTTEGPAAARIAKTRLVQVGWQHFALCRPLRRT